MRCDFGFGLIVLALIPACSRSGYVGPALADEDCETEQGKCASVLCAPTLADAEHVEVCSKLAHHSNPPTSGAHYPIWAAYKIYDKPVPRGFTLHSIEHSGVVLSYNCDLYDGSCAELVGELTQFRQLQPDDPLCDAAVRTRIIVTPDPLLSVPYAAAAWGHSLKGQCFDANLTAQFVESFYGKNYENFCSDGVDPVAAGSGFDSNCGK